MKDFSNYPLSSMELINWRNKEPHCSKPVIRLLLHENINAEALQKALDQTVQRYPVLHLTTASINGEIRYTKTEKIHPVQEGIDEISLCFNDGYAPWCVRYENKCIAFCFHHGLMDGRAAFEVMKTLLYYYALHLGKDVSADGIRTLNDPDVLIEEESLDPVARCYKKGLIPLKEKTALAASRYKESVVSGQHYCRLLVDKQAFMKAVKDLDTSPFALTSVLLARSLKEYYDEKPVINIGIVADYRTIFQIESMHNFISMGVISYECAAMDDKSLQLACTMFRSVLDVMLQKENANRHLEDSIKLSMLLRPDPFSEQAEQILQYIRSIQASASFIISYIGRFLLPSGLKEMVNDIYLHVPSGSANLMEMVDLNDRFVLNIHHVFNNIDFIKSLQTQLDAMHIPSQYEGDLETPKVHL